MLSLRPRGSAVDGGAWTCPRPMHPLPCRSHLYCPGARRTQMCGTSTRASTPRATGSGRRGRDGGVQAGPAPQHSIDAQRVPGPRFRMLAHPLPCPRLLEFTQLLSIAQQPPRLLNFPFPTLPTHPLHRSPSYPPCSGGRQLQPLHQTPLHIAAETGDAGIAETLLRWGQCWRVARMAGKRPVQHAAASTGSPPACSPPRPADLTRCPRPAPRPRAMLTALCPPARRTRPAWTQRRRRPLVPGL